MKNKFATLLISVLLLPGMISCLRQTEIPLDDLSNITPASEAKQTCYRLLALGDSYTIGEGVTAAESWPVQLTEKLREDGIPVDDPIIIAKTGWRTDQLLQAVQSTDTEKDFDFVFVLIGVNDQVAETTELEYRQNFASLLEIALALAGGTPSNLIVLSIPDWGVTPIGAQFQPNQIAIQINTFNAINQSEAEKINAQYIDITAISRRAKSQPELLAADELHPSAAMYSEWVEIILPKVKDLIVN